MKELWEKYLIQAYYYQIEKNQHKIYWKFTWVLLATSVQVYFTISLILYSHKTLNYLGYFNDVQFSNSERKFVFFSVPIFLTIFYMIYNYNYLFKKNRYLLLLKKYEKPEKYNIYFLLSFGSLFLMISFGLIMF